MMRIRTRRGARRGLAATEMALLLPAFCLMCLAATDYARVFYSLSTLSDCARAGALYYATRSNATTATVQAAALADATNLTSPAPTIASSSGTDASGNSYVQVTASYTFTALSPFGVIPAGTSLSRTVVMMPNPASP